MTVQTRFWVALSLLSLTFALPAVASAGDQIEPNAGRWRTWVISSGADYRAPAPPNPAQTEAEIRQMDGIVYINDGDWVESCTAVVEHADGRFEILDWAQTKRRASLAPAALALAAA